MSMHVELIIFLWDMNLHLYRSAEEIELSVQKYTYEGILMHRERNLFWEDNLLFPSVRRSNLICANGHEQILSLGSSNE